MNYIDKIRHLFQPMLTCEQVNDFIMDYLDDRLSDDIKSRFEKHLHMCASCTPFLDQYQKTVELVAQDGQIEVPADLAEHTMLFLRQNLPDLKR